MSSCFDCVDEGVVLFGGVEDFEFGRFVVVFLGEVGGWELG